MIQRFARICKDLLQIHIQGLDLCRESFKPELGVILVRQVQDLGKGAVVGFEIATRKAGGDCDVQPAVVHVDSRSIELDATEFSL